MMLAQPETMEEKEVLVWRNGKAVLQLELKNAKEVSMVWGERSFPFAKEENKWVLELPFSTAVNYVQICVDGQEVLISDLPIAHGFSRVCNYIELPDGNELSEIKDIPHGSLTQEFYYSAISDNLERLVIYLPAGVPASGLPVLYLQHGYGESEISWSTTGKVNILMDNLIAAGKIRPFAIVMGDGMVKQKIGGEYKLNHELFEHMLVEEVIPFVEHKYQFGGAKEKRGMAGLSMGSAQTTRTVCDHPELFCEVGLFSGFLRDRIQGNPERDGIEREPWDQSHLKTMERPDFNSYFKTFFRAIGDEDGFLPEFLEEDKMIQEKGVREIRKIYHGGHDWNVWRPCFADFAQLIFR